MPVGERLTFSADGMPLGAFVRWVSNTTSTSIVVEAGLDDQPVTLDVIDQEVGTVLALVARRLGVELTRTGDVYYLGRLRSEDRGILVRKIRRLSSSDITAAIATMLSNVGTSQVYPDGLAIISDRVEVLGRVVELLDRIEAAPADSWVVQLYLLDLSDIEQSQIGLDVEPALDIAATFARASSGITVPADGAAVVASLSAMLRAARTQRATSIVATPMFLLADGGTGTLRQGQTIPVPQRTTSPEGTVTISGFTDVQAGLTIIVGVRESSGDAVHLSVSVQMSEVVALIADERPATVDAAVETSAVIQSGGVYLIGSSERTAQRHGVEGIARAVRTVDDELRTLQVWARAYKVRRPAGDSRPERSGGSESTQADPGGEP